jgi:hypothetical protein
VTYRLGGSCTRRSLNKSITNRGMVSWGEIVPGQGEGGEERWCWCSGGGGGGGGGLTYRLGGRCTNTRRNTGRRRRVRSLNTGVRKRGRGWEERGGGWCSSGGGGGGGSTYRLWDRCTRSSLNTGIGNKLRS